MYNNTGVSIDLLTPSYLKFLIYTRRDHLRVRDHRDRQVGYIKRVREYAYNHSNNVQNAWLVCFTLQIACTCSSLNSAGSKT